MMTEYSRYKNWWIRQILKKLVSEFDVDNVKKFGGALAEVYQKVYKITS